MRRTKFVEAHTTALACIALSLDGKLLATASERGTLVRVFSTADGSKVQVSPDSSVQWAMKQAAKEYPLSSGYRQYLWTVCAPAIVVAIQFISLSAV